MYLHSKSIMHCDIKSLNFLGALPARIFPYSIDLAASLDPIADDVLSSIHPLMSSDGEPEYQTGGPG
jgi:serine/threonine protein kinase